VRKLALRSLSALLLVELTSCVTAYERPVRPAYRPLEGRRYETMRELARILDRRAVRAADRAQDTTRWRGREENRFLDSVTHFARRAREFRRRMDSYLDSPWDVPADIVDLDRDARDVSYRIRRARVYEDTYEDWDALLDVLARMNRLAQGYEVRVPRY